MERYLCVQEQIDLKTEIVDFACQRLPSMQPEPAALRNAVDRCEGLACVHRGILMHQRLAFHNICGSLVRFTSSQACLGFPMTVARPSPLSLTVSSACVASPGSRVEPPSTCAWLLSVGSCSGIGLAAGALIADRSSASPPCLSGDGRPNKAWFRATFSDVGALGLDVLVGCRSDHTEPRCLGCQFP